MPKTPVPKWPHAFGGLLLVLFLFSPPPAFAEPASQETPAIEKLAGPVGMTEGPALDSEGRLYFSDLSRGRTLRWNGPGRVEILRMPSGHANGLALDGEDRVLFCEQHTGRITRLEKDGGLSILADTYNGQRLNHPNDLAAGRDGSVYFSDPPGGPQAAGLYHLTPAGQLKLVTSDLEFPNGVALDREGRYLYAADMNAGAIWRYTIAAGGTPEDGRVWARAESPDGLCTDEAGRVYAAEYATSRIKVFDAGGRFERFIAAPESPVRNCVAGDDGAFLYVTAGASLYRLLLERE